MTSAMRLLIFSSILEVYSGIYIHDAQSLYDTLRLIQIIQSDIPAKSFVSAIYAYIPEMSSRPVWFSNIGKLILLKLHFSDDPDVQAYK